MQNPTILRDKILALLDFSHDDLWIECVEELSREELHEVVSILLDRIDDLDSQVVGLLKVLESTF